MYTCYETAIETFKAIFGNRDEFRDEEAINGFLAAATLADDRYILHTLYKWMEAAMTQYGAEEGLLHLTAYTVEELSRKMEPFVRTCTYIPGDEGGSSPSLWPLVEIVRVGLQRPLLQRSIVLADLPGLSDINKIRKRSTMQYIQKCEAILLVAPVLRVETDNLVNKRLKEFSRAFGSQKALVLTKVDDTQALRKPSDLEATQEATKRYERLSLASSSQIRQISRIVKLRDAAAGKEKEDLTRQISDLQLEKKAYDALHREALVLMRNEKTKRNMRRKYKTMTSDPLPLAVFTVSSVDYNVQKSGYDEYRDFPLTVQTSGIPELRHYCIQFPAKSRLDALVHYRDGVLAELISSLYIWSSQYKVQRRSALKKIVAKPLQEAESKIARYVHEIKLRLDETVLDKSIKNEKTWIEHSLEAFGEWTSWHPATFSAFCKHDGMWQTPAQPYRDWNAEMLEPVVKDMAQAWEVLEEALIDCKEQCISVLIKLLDDVRSDLNDMSGVAAEPMLPFLASLTPRKVQIRKCLGDFSESIKLFSRIAKVKVDMIGQDPDCFLMQAMGPVYAKCARQKGKEGNRMRQKISTARNTLMEDALSKGEQFSRIRSGIEEIFEQELDAQQPKLTALVQEVFHKVIEDFDLMFVVEELPDAQRDILRGQVQRFVDKAKSTIDGRVAVEFAKATMDSA